jgi:hypothetical protein
MTQVPITRPKRVFDEGVGPDIDRHPQILPRVN